MPYDAQQYQLEKAEGVRRPNGAIKLTKLSGKHLRCIALHMSGMKGGEIAAAMGMTGAWVSMILNDPLAKAEIQQRFLDLDGEMIARATQIVSAKMESADDAIALRAADMVFRAHGRYDKKVDDRPSAEDVVQRMLALAQAGGTASLTVSGGRPPPGGPIIEGNEP